MLTALEPVLTDRGRVLAGVVVDGVPRDGPGDTDWVTVQRVEIHSLTLADAVAKVAAECADRADAIRADAESLACEVMRVVWSDMAGACVALATRAGELMRDASGVLGMLPALAVPAEGVAEAVNRWVAAIEARDAAAVCLALDGAVIPALQVFALELRAVRVGA
jgi:hypothetical protein